MRIRLASVHIAGNTVHYRLDVPGPLRKYFLRGTSYARFEGGVDLSGVDKSMLVIPMLSTIVPIAWAVGADVEVDEIDAAYLESLGKVKEVYRSLYPHLSYSGEIHAGSAVTNAFGGKRAALLFSGGVDSLTSYLRRRGEKPDLIVVQGTLDAPTADRKHWRALSGDIRGLADADGVEAFQVRTDIVEGINHELLSRQAGISWYGLAAMGLFLLGMCAPVTAARGVGTLIIASSYTDDFGEPSAFRPVIDQSVSWADVAVVHDGYELSRQDKLRYLCQMENRDCLSRLRVCWYGGVPTNCGRCEKCQRTIVGLLVEGVDPNECNFDADEKTLPRIRESFVKGKTILDAGQRFQWLRIQERIPERIDADIHGSREFLSWLKGFDLSAYRGYSPPSVIWEAQIVKRRRARLAYIRRKARCWYFMVLDRLGLA